MNPCDISGSDSDNFKQSKHTNPMTQPTLKTKVQYWKSKVTHIEDCFIKVGAGLGSNYYYAQSAYQLAINSNNDRHAFQALEKFHTTLKDLVSMCYKYQTQILETLGPGEILEELLDLRGWISSQVFVVKVGYGY
ncbi:hypothetical protein E1B28_006808 [Marasmius oreades]|uniref:Uncharacterized protein n=1 Tax=Marasmius oreades TaxID=181124 RepID=A0A9P8AAU7_9AGAR|nr:uncharacterized protein E1B28_006808 [Marasmius oreades]KAG7096134.1 hypothetical protein E1B28_006808 [Marasmius oreades]